MAGINVLSDTLKGGTKLEKTLTSKGNDITDSPGNAATAFAAMLSGSMNLIANPRGQNSSGVGQELEEKQSADNLILSVQNPNGQGSMLGYGNFALSIFTQPILQSELPAGKEANSGDDVSQGTGDLTTSNQALIIKPNISGNNLELARLNMVSTASDEISAQSGMTTPKSQGDNPGITELDKYRQVIADLLVALSGEITDSSPKAMTSSSTEGTGIKDLSQDMAKVVQSWMMLTDEGVNKEQTSSGVAFSSKRNILSSEDTGVKDLGWDFAKIIQQKGIQPLVDRFSTAQGFVNPELNAKVSTLLAAFYPILSQGADDARDPEGVKETLQAEGDMIDSGAKGRLETSTDKPVGFGNTIVPAITGAKDTATALINSQPKSTVVDLQERMAIKNVQEDPSQSSELSEVKDVQNQNLNKSIGFVNNLVATNVPDGKTVAIPVWEQISTVVRVQVLNGHQVLKELDIQLHPADLGKIQIAMRWENGQVHLQVQASEAATGQLLQNQLSDLRQALTGQGVNCGMLQMGQSGERQQNHQGDASQRTFKQSSELNEDGDQISVVTPLSLGQDQISRINVTA